MQKLLGNFALSGYEVDCYGSCKKLRINSKYSKRPCKVPLQKRVFIARESGTQRSNYRSSLDLAAYFTCFKHFKTFTLKKEIIDLHQIFP